MERLIQYILEAYEVNDSNTINNDYGIEERNLIEENEQLKEQLDSTSVRRAV